MLCTVRVLLCRFHVSSFRIRCDSNIFGGFSFEAVDLFSWTSIPIVSTSPTSNTRTYFPPRSLFWERSAKITSKSIHLHPKKPRIVQNAVWNFQLSQNPSCITLFTRCVSFVWRSNTGNSLRIDRGRGTPSASCSTDSGSASWNIGHCSVTNQRLFRNNEHQRSELNFILLSQFVEEVKLHVILITLHNLGWNNNETSMHAQIWEEIKEIKRVGSTLCKG